MCELSMYLASTTVKITLCSELVMEKNSTGRQNKNTAFGSLKRFSTQLISEKILVQ